MLCSASTVTTVRRGLPVWLKDFTLSIKTYTRTHARTRSGGEGRGRGTCALTVDKPVSMAAALHWRVCMAQGEDMKLQDRRNQGLAKERELATLS